MRTSNPIGIAITSSRPVGMRYWRAPGLFLAIYCVVAIAFTAALIAAHGLDMMMTLLIWPIILAVLVYPRWVYMIMTALLLLLSCFVVYFLSDIVSRALGIVAIFAIFMFVTAEIMLYILRVRTQTVQALHDSEARLRSIVDSLNEGLIITDLNDIVLSANARSEEITGYAVREMIGRQIFRLLAAPQSWPEVEARRARSVQDQPERYELMLRRKNGHAMWVENNAAPLRDASNRVIGTLNALTDISERKTSQDALIRAHTAALESARLKTEFLANISHEVRTPMNGIIGMGQLLLTSDPSPDQEEYLTALLDESHALLKLINSVLDLATIEAGKLVLDYDDFELLSVVERATEMQAAKASEKKLALTAYVSPKIPALLRGDQHRLGQILTHLIENAVKFTSQGEVVVRAELIPTEGQQVTVRFSVTDTGIGVPPAKREMIFEPFRQVDGSSTRRYAGAGLGLAISRRLVDMMNGKIGLENGHERGSIFWFSLSFQRSVLEDLSFEELSTESLRPISLQILQQARVLYVGPNGGVASTLGAYLRCWEITRFKWMLPETCLGWMRSEEAEQAVPYTVAFIDALSPELGALANVFQNSPQWANTRLVMLHGVCSPSMPVQTYPAFSECLEMPFRRAQLFNLVSAQARG